MAKNGCHTCFLYYLSEVQPSHLYSTVKSILLTTVGDVLW